MQHSTTAHDFEDREICQKDCQQQTQKPGIHRRTTETNAKRTIAATSINVNPGTAVRNLRAGRSLDAVDVATRMLQKSARRRRQKA